MTTNMQSFCVELSQRFFFDAAHRLQRKVQTESSRRIHGHTYHAEVAMHGQINQETGMLIDLGVVQEKVATIRALLDHHFLDEVEGLGIPTLENLCVFIAQKMNALGLPLARVSVWREAVGDRCDLRLSAVNNAN